MNFTEPAEFLVSLIQHSDRVSIDVEMLDWLVVFGEFSLKSEGEKCLL